jgi:hypothetical protein
MERTAEHNEEEEKKFKWSINLYHRTECSRELLLLLLALPSEFRFFLLAFLFFFD